MLGMRTRPLSLFRGVSVMRLLYPICAGLDVHKDTVTVCLLQHGAGTEATAEIRTVATFTADLEALRQWLWTAGCQAIALESTGSYWRPVWNVLVELDVPLYLVNPGQLERAPGKKTDAADSRWLAERLAVGALQGSYVPPQVILDARELTRYRRRLVQQHTDEANRLQKVLEGANIKLASVATDILGKTGRAALKALIADQPFDFETQVKGRLRTKRAELAAALTGRVRSHHRVLLGQILAHLEYLEGAIAQLDQQLEELLRPFAVLLDLLRTIPGVQQRAAEDILAEIGPDMSAFPTHKHLCSWAALCPGNKESGGKRLSGKTRKGNRWLRGVLIECALAAARTNGSDLSAEYRRLRARKGPQRAAVAVAHSILQACYFILRDAVPYQAPVRTVTAAQRDRQIRRTARQLAALGVSVDPDWLTQGLADPPMAETGRPAQRPDPETAATIAA